MIRLVFAALPPITAMLLGVMLGWDMAKIRGLWSILIPALICSCLIMVGDERKR